MSDEILNTVEVLTARIRAKEEEANKLKRLVNELCGEAGIDPRFHNIPSEGASVSTIRSDHFYGQTLPAAIRNYLELRKSSGLGAASVGEIYRAIKDGGYKFETNREENAKISVGNALRKTSSIFHRLPNGQFGLLSWYPSAKNKSESQKERTKGDPIEGEPEESVKVNTGSQNGNRANIKDSAVTQKEIRDIVLEQAGQFSASDIEEKIKTQFPSKALPKTKIPSVLFVLTRKKGLLRQVSEKIGRKGAVYEKI